MRTRTIFLIAGLLIASALPTTAEAGWVSGYFRDNGTYVSGYYRTEPNYYKYDNLSWDGDWSDAYNDKSWYRDYGYDPEPWDNEEPNYSYWDSYDYDSYEYSYDDYDYDDYSLDYYDYSDSTYDDYDYYSYDDYGSSYDDYSWDYDFDNSYDDYIWY